MQLKFVAFFVVSMICFKGTTFPVGKVDFLRLFPLSFKEFLLALGLDRFVELIDKGEYEMAAGFRQTYIDALKQYYYVGGMPEAVGEFSESKDFNEVREIQKKILAAYEQDFSKHAPRGAVPRIRMLWNSIPSQLAKENKKFIYGLIREGARAKDYETALMWLSDCGLIHIVRRINGPGLPLKAYVDMRSFKLFMLDVGLLSCMTGLRSQTLLDGNSLFREFKGALTEQYVLQQLVAMRDIDTYYYTNERSSSEIDFVIDTGDKVVPIEVKAELNLMAKSLRAYREKFKPELAVRTAMTDHRLDGGLLNLPLYSFWKIQDI